MRLVVVHYHLRPGGVRRVIEEAICHLLRHADPAITEIVLASGARPDASWRDRFARLTRGTPVRYVVARAFGYVSEHPAPTARRDTELRRAVARLLAEVAPDDVVWFHNPGLGRNLPLVRELTRACAAAGIPFIAHHHDWWFDNRWQRLPEMRHGGVRTLRDIARVIFPALPCTGHAAINRRDADDLSRGCRAPVAWLPNPAASPAPSPRLPRSRRTMASARAWLRDRIGHDAPVYLLPCRFLRRKNIAEALLLTRWLHPDAWLVTTGGVSSADEQRYFERLDAAIRRHHWPARLAVMRGDERRKPSVDELVAAVDAVMLTSIQEGFGLPYIEAAAARRPLLARRLPDIAPDLDAFGFRFPYLYDELLVPPDLFDRGAEQARQAALLTRWKRDLPASCRRLVRDLPLLQTVPSRPVPFSRLTLTAQLEVLAHATETSWTACAPLNPFLRAWRRAALAGRLRETSWPRQAERWLGGAAYARRFSELLAAVRAQRLPPAGDFAAQELFIRERLDAERLFPLLLSSDT